jgi:hypothetical protein
MRSEYLNRKKIKKNYKAHFEKLYQFILTFQTCDLSHYIFLLSNSTISGTHQQEKDVATLPMTWWKAIFGNWETSHCPKGASVSHVWVGIPPVPTTFYLFIIIFIY